MLKRKRKTKPFIVIDESTSPFCIHCGNKKHQQNDNCTFINNNFEPDGAKCAIYEQRPAMCKEFPITLDGNHCLLIGGCGFSYGENGLEGECLRCGYCCSIPRKQGAPQGKADPKGEPCRHLLI